MQFAWESSSTFPSSLVQNSCSLFPSLPQPKPLICMHPQTLQYMYTYTIYPIFNIISIYRLAPSPKSWHITSKVCCPCQNGLCRTLPTTPQDQQQVLVHERISASNAPKHIFPHWDMTSEKPTKISRQVVQQQKHTHW